MRMDDYQEFINLSFELAQEIESSPEFLKLFLKLFTSPKFIEEYFLLITDFDKCRVLAQILVQALKKCY